MAVTQVTNSTFESFVSSGLVIVDCWAPWCPPCRRMGPIIDKLSEIEDKIKVGKLNTDENQMISMMFNISSIPTLLFFKDGKHVDTIVGLDPSLTPELLRNFMLEL